VNDLPALTATVEGYLDDYNTFSKKQMVLVLFLFALEHVARISRVLNMPGGNVLLVGVGGSGRQSLSRLAASMADQELVQIEISKNYGEQEWHDDLKKVLRSAGTGNRGAVFLFSDTQVMTSLLCCGSLIGVAIRSKVRHLLKTLTIS
jgi:dynein heavy chain